MGGPTQKRKIFLQMCAPSLGARCGVIIVFGHASTYGSIYKTDSLFSAPARVGGGHTRTM